MKMNKMTAANGFLAAVAVAMTVATPTLALAAQGYRARAQAPVAWQDSGGGAPLSPQRVRALKDCTAVEQKMGTNFTWGAQQLDVYRACMYSHGQAE
jgi:hypothetical protein